MASLHSVAGQCACGEVRYTCCVESEAALCACETCRRASGSTWQAWVDGDRASLIVEGNTSNWASSDHATRHFCARCGSPLFLFEHADPATVEIAAGTLDAPDGIVSTRWSRAYAGERPAWSRWRDETP